MRHERPAGAMLLRAISRSRIAEPKLMLLAVGAVVVTVLFIVALADTGDVWLVPLTALAIALIGAAIVLDLRRVISVGQGTPAVKTPPGRAIVVSTMPMTATEVLDALGPEDGEARSIMVSAPPGCGEEAGWSTSASTSAHTTQRPPPSPRCGAPASTPRTGSATATGAARSRTHLRCSRVVVVAHGIEADVYREHLDIHELKTRSVELHLREVLEAE
jgi:hypothetical protein